MVDIVIMDNSSDEVVFVKADENEIADKYENNVELYLVRYLGYRLSDINWMCSNSISVKMYNGMPFGGVEQTYNGYFD